MDINLIKTFLEIEKTRHFGRAADNLYLTQAAISARVKQLEETLGKPLFERYRNNIQLTQAGEEFLPFAVQIVELWYMTYAKMRQDEQMEFINIAAPALIWQTRLANLPERLLVNNPKLQLNAQYLSSSSVFDQLLTHKVDIGFSFFPPKQSEIQINKTLKIPMAFYAHQPKWQMDDINSANLISVSIDDLSEINWKNWFKQDIRPRFYAADWFMAIEYMAQQGGAALLPKSLVKPKSGLYLVKDSPLVKQPFYLCSAKSIEENEPKKATLKFIKTVFFAQKSALESFENHTEIN
ncbi:LysR family transcriptional regulator [Aliikangiella maris]|uniref:LysR family transcriptional regulator n=2 Tax=Aliikangiella maris TaxID=3162458 RepID=A0ABV2BVD3_9GAMM